MTKITDKIIAGSLLLAAGSFAAKSIKDIIGSKKQENEDDVLVEESIEEIKVEEIKVEKPSKKKKVNAKES